MTTLAPKPHPCPACDLPLAVSHRLLQDGDSVIDMYCPHGICASAAANIGAEADTVEEAFRLLEAAVENEAVLDARKANP